MSDNNNQKLHRTLKARHMNMIALGGAIGTGLFVAGVCGVELLAATQQVFNFFGKRLGLSGQLQCFVAGITQFSKQGG